MVVALHRAHRDGRPVFWCCRALANSATVWAGLRLISFTRGSWWSVHCDWPENCRQMGMHGCTGGGRKACAECFGRVARAVLGSKPRIFLRMLRSDVPVFRYFAERGTFAKRRRTPLAPRCALRERASRRRICIYVCMSHCAVRAIVSRRPRARPGGGRRRRARPARLRSRRRLRRVTRRSPRRRLGEPSACASGRGASHASSSPSPVLW